MGRRLFLPLLLLAVVALASLPAWAAPRDAAANKKITEAVHKHYLVTDFDKAESVLLKTIAACGGKCSNPVLAKAWMYVGVVRGSGRNDQRGAKKAFQSALSADPSVKLDDALATPKTKKTFAAAKKEAPAAVSTPEVEAGTSDGGGGGEMDCTPKVSAVQTRRPIPVSCTVGDQAKRVELHYKAGKQSWQKVRMKNKGDTFQSTIPCQATGRRGTLSFYVTVRDDEGDIVQRYGEKRAPKEIEIARDPDEDPPAFPDEDPPKRCSSAKVEEGVSCESNEDCDSDLSCVSGSCRELRSCDVDDECEGGERCRDGKCQTKPKQKSGPVKHSWLGLHVGYDFALVGGEGVCNPDNGEFACFYKDTEDRYGFEPNPSFANNIKTGIAPATIRLMASFDQLFGDNITAGGRLGYAFGGGPPAGASKEVKFFPFHLEARVSYWFGEKPFAREGVRPYVGAGGGAAQVDAKVPIKVADCAGGPDGPSQPGQTVANDSNYYRDCRRGGTNRDGFELELDAYKKLGQAFFGLHGGIVYAFSQNSGVQLNLNVMQFLPTSGQVLEPSIGFVQGI
ncbi:MAG: hypothetical protein R3B13_12610 [Polyangiaceae bacterium]